MSTNPNDDHWFKIRATPEEIRRIERLAKCRNMDMSAYVRWLITQDQKVQESLPKQASFSLFADIPQKTGKGCYNE